MLWQYELTRSTFNHAGFTIDSCCMPLVWQYKTKKVQIYTQKYLGKLFFYSYRLFLLYFKILPCSEEILSCALILKKCSVHFLLYRKCKFTFAFQTNHSSYPFLVGFADQTGNIVLAEQVVLWSDVLINPDGLYDTTTGNRFRVL